MYVIVLSFLLFFLCSLIGYFWHTQSTIRGEFRASGPRSISEGLARRNKKSIIVAIFLVVCVAVLEALVPDVAYWFQDLQTMMGGRLPEWGIVFLESGGGISWGLYVAIIIALILGVFGGTLIGCKQYSRTKSFGLSEVS
ncbi:MAG: hypothetical protein ABEL51_03570 [Salinibacter sp.]